MGPGFSLLLIAQSARMLAQSAARGGYESIVMDRYGDEDTLAAATNSLIVPDFDAPDCLGAVTRLVPHKDSCGVIYGGGIDTRAELLERLEAGRTLFGNKPATVRRVYDPRRFFTLLNQLGIPYPETCFEAPESLGGWLMKSACREGGMGVRFPAEKNAPDALEYFQRYVAGPVCSLLFLADGQVIVPVGFNTLWTATHDPDHPFLFAGAINRAVLGIAQRVSLIEYAGKLTRELGLLGLNGLDFVLDGGICRVLELNPRPSATMQLYDKDFPSGLVHAHIAACRGELGVVSAPAGPVRAFRVIYAPQAVGLPSERRLPPWCADRPALGARVATGAPLCTVQAEGRAEAQVLNLLAERTESLLSWLGL